MNCERVCFCSFGGSKFREARVLKAQMRPEVSGASVNRDLMVAREVDLVQNSAVKGEEEGGSLDV